MKRWRRALLEGLAATLIASSAWAQTPLSVAPSQRDAIFNAQVVSATNAAAVKTVTGVSNERVRVHSLSAYCSGGTATLTITEAGTTVFSTPAGAINTAMGGAAWPPATYTAARGATVVITLSTCGAGNVGTLNSFADRY